MTWLLIVHLIGGGIRVSTTPDMVSCVARSTFELRMPNVRTTDCVAWRGIVA